MSCDKAENFLDKSSAVNSFNNAVPTSLQLTQRDSLDNICDNGAKPNPLLKMHFNRRVVVDRLSASWSLVCVPV